jgi:hypothetical protein
MTTTTMSRTIIRAITISKSTREGHAQGHYHDRQQQEEADKQQATTRRPLRRFLARLLPSHLPDAPPNKPGIELPKPDVGRESAEPLGEVTVYEAPEGGPRVEVIVGEETVWLTQAQMADLFGRDQSVIARHIRHVYQESELPEEGSMQNLHRTSEEGGRPAVVYNLDVVISVGYRVKSQQGTQFRIWPPTLSRTT